MAKRLRPVGHEDRLSIVEHLDELRSRLIICGIALAVAFGICFWQNNSLISVLNRALPHASTVTNHHGLAAVASESVRERNGFLKAANADRELASSQRLSPSDRQAFAQAAQGLTEAAKALPSSAPTQERPITIGVGEPFTTTLVVCAYFALLFTLPLIIYQGYAFVIPALNPNERRVATPVMMVAPALFIAGAGFAYYFILPPAVHFLQGYNSNEFNTLVQAKAYYSFEILTMLGVGLSFQMPLGLLALQRLGVITSRTLIRNWRYATVIIAVIAAAMPGADPVTTGLQMLPLVVLFLASIVLLAIADRRAEARAAAELAQMGDSLEVS
ncbi:MAG: twin-arginine translocase subunit TatC [Actinomycetota bacterium]|nr:twin-arginine translocase subunit TatC [Actinomycetota bacterium]